MIRNVCTLLLLAVLAVASGCGMAAKNAAEAPPRAPGEDLDPFAYSDEFSVNETSRYSPETRNTEPASPSETTQIRPSVPIAGESGQSVIPADPATPPPGTVYRVQIGIDEDKEKMEALAERAENRLDYPVYLIYEAPFYRVQVGDFRNADEANRQVRLLKEKGYKNALRVMP